ALPGLARCERPSGALARASSDHPGRLAQGPEEKLGLAGRMSGMEAFVIVVLPFQIARLSLGRGGPLAALRLCGENRKGKIGRMLSRREKLFKRKTAGRSPPPLPEMSGLLPQIVAQADPDEMFLVAL